VPIPVSQVPWPEKALQGDPSLPVGHLRSGQGDEEEQAKTKFCGGLMLH